MKYKCLVRLKQRLNQKLRIKKYPQVIFSRSNLNFNKKNLKETLLCKNLSMIITKRRHENKMEFHSNLLFFDKEFIFIYYHKICMFLEEIINLKKMKF